MLDCHGLNALTDMPPSQMPCHRDRAGFPERWLALVRSEDAKVDAVPALHSGTETADVECHTAHLQPPT